MFASNGKISNRQIFRLFVFDLMGIATLLVPPHLAKLCGIDGVFCILLGTIAGFLYLFYLGWIMKRMGKDICSYLEEKKGTFVKNVTFYLVFAHCILTAGFCANVFANLMQYSLIKESSFVVILAVIVLVSLYAVSGGIESRARVYEVLFWFVLIPYVAMMLASVKDFELEYVDGFFGASWVDVLQGSYLVFLFLTPLFFSLFLEGERETTYGKNLVKIVAKCIVVTSVILLGSYFLLVGNFGEGALATMDYPVVTLMSTIQFRGNFLKRMDSIMVAVWFFTLFALLNLHLHYGVSMQKKIIGETKSMKWYYLAIPFLLVFVIGYGLQLIETAMDWFINYYAYVAVPGMIIGPVLLLVRGK